MLQPYVESLEGLPDLGPLEMPELPDDFDTWPEALRTHALAIRDAQQAMLDALPDQMLAMYGDENLAQRAAEEAARKEAEKRRERGLEVDGPIPLPRDRPRPGPLTTTTADRHSQELTP